MISSSCDVVGCVRNVQCRGLCDPHYRRWRKAGHPGEAAIRPKHVSGDQHPLWVADDAGYAVVHQRLARSRGAARGHTCAHCGQPAKHWAYDKTDPDPKIDDRGCFYSTDLSRYIALCVSCHWTFDGAVDRLSKAVAK